MSPCTGGRSIVWLGVVSVLLAACSVPDAAHFAEVPITPTSGSTGSTGSTSVSSQSQSMASSPAEAGTSDTSATAAPGSLAASIGAGAVTPWGMVTQEDIDRAAALVASLTVPQKAGSVIMASSADAVGTSEVADLGLGGVILMGSKGDVDGTRGGTPGQVSAVTRALRGQVPATFADFPLLVGTDQEYGDVTRLVNGFTSFPGASELGSIGDLPTAVRITHDVAAAAAAELAAVGVNLDFAPVSDVLPIDGVSSIGDRSYGSDPERVGALVAAAVQGYQGAGVAATLKHFPGIGELSTDTHVALPTLQTNCARWNSSASAPVRSGVGAGVSLVMTGHTLFPAVDTGSEPTSLSRIVLTDLLRGDPATPLPSGCTPVGFHGLAVSDSLQMVPIADRYGSGEAAWRALAAGQDLLLMPVRPTEAVTGIVAAVADGSLTQTRLNEAAVRVLALRATLSRTPTPGLDVIDSAEHRAVAAKARQAING